MSVCVSTKYIFRSSYPPAEEYVNYVDRSHVNLVDIFKHMQLDDDEPHENGELDHEVTLCFFLVK